MVVVNQVFHTRKNFSENYFQFGLASSNIFSGPVLRWKSLKNIGLKGCQIISLPGGGGHMPRAGPANDNTINLAVLKTLLRNRTHHQPYECFFALCITLSGSHRLARRKNWYQNSVNCRIFKKMFWLKGH